MYIPKLKFRLGITVVAIYSKYTSESVSKIPWLNAVVAGVFTWIPLALAKDCLRALNTSPTT